MQNPYALVRPFGSVEAGTDADLLDLFVRVPHAMKATDPGVAVLTGRRAAGKTAVAVFLEKASEPRFDVVVHFDQKKLLAQFLLLDERDRSGQKAAVVGTALTGDQFVDYWMFAIWHAITAELHRTEPFLASTDRELFQAAAQEVFALARAADELLYAGVGDQYTRDVALLRILELTGTFQKSYTFEVLEQMVRQYVEAGSRVIVITDTIEDYRVRNELIDRALCGLLTAWVGFAGKVSHRNLHAKCFFPAEIYRYLKINAPQFNIRKVEQHMVHLRWTPKQLRNMLSKRMGHWLQEHHPDGAAELGLAGLSEAELDRVVWTRIFPATVLNQQRVEEDTFIYIARHTQLHPGQLIWLCNVIAEKASDDGCFPPRIHPRHVIAGVNEVESKIASSVLTPYEPVYPKITEIFQKAFAGCPNLMSYRDFSELYRKALGVWPQAEYEASGDTFERMALESGVVGRRRNSTEKYHVSYFEYDSNQELHFGREDLCAVHPAFYDLLAINTAGSKQFVCPHVVVPDDPDEP